LVTAVKRAGLKKVTWHMFRHTIATRLLETTDLVTVKEILGHESIKTTLRYAHTSADRKRRAVDNLNGGHGDKIVTIVPRKKVG
jgi:site-specific recombinase XerD